MGSHTHTWDAIKHTYTHFFPQQIRLVLINLAGGTQHVFPFTSCPAPRAARWKPSILVCLQFVCLNFFANLGYLACWSCSGRPMLFIPLRHNTSRPFYPPTASKKPASDHLLLPASKKSPVFVVFAIDSLLKQVELLEQGIISLCCENSEEASKGPRLSNYGGQMFFFLPCFSIWAAFTTAYHPLDNFAVSLEWRKRCHGRFHREVRSLMPVWWNLLYAKPVLMWLWTLIH